MKNFMLCRRTYICTLALGGLLALGVWKNQDVSMAMATVAMGLAGANAYEGSEKAKAASITEYKG